MGNIIENVIRNGDDIVNIKEKRAYKEIKGLGKGEVLEEYFEEKTRGKEIKSLIYICAHGFLEDLLEYNISGIFIICNNSLFNLM